MPSITVRNYNPESGVLLGNVSILDYGKITLGSHSRVQVLDVAFESVTVVSNIKIGIIASGGITVISSGNVGHFGVTDSADFNATLASEPITSHFLGTNTTGTASDANNVSIGSRSSTLSNYIYLDIELGSTNLAAGNGAYKIFFDYS